MLYVAFTVLSLCHSPSVTLAFVLKWVVRNRLDPETWYCNPSHPSIPLSLYRLSYPILLIIDKTLYQVSPYESVISDIWRNVNWSESFIMAQVSQHEKAKFNWTSWYTITVVKIGVLKVRRFHRGSSVNSICMHSMFCPMCLNVDPEKGGHRAGTKLIECVYYFKQKHRISEI